MGGWKRTRRKAHLTYKDLWRGGVALVEPPSNERMRPLARANSGIAQTGRESCKGPYVSQVNPEAYNLRSFRTDSSRVILHTRNRFHQLVGSYTRAMLNLRRANVDDRDPHRWDPYPLEGAGADLYCLRAAAGVLLLCA